MIYLAIDTCVWLELLKIDFLNKDNYFDELLFWIENGHVIFVTTENLEREWMRNKDVKKQEILKSFKEKKREIAGMMSAVHQLDNMYEPDKVEASIHNRMSRIDMLFSNKAIIAKESDEIYLEATKRNLNCSPPNHAKDSFRDTINLLTLKKHSQDHGYSKCIFTTINYKDFSEGNERYTLHSQLEQDFTEGNLEYVFFDTSIKAFSGKLFKIELRPHLPSFSQHLLEEKRKQESRLLTERKIQQRNNMDLEDDEFVSNTAQIDRIILSGKQTALDKKILDFLFEMNQSYQLYFFKKLAENELV